MHSEGGAIVEVAFLLTGTTLAPQVTRPWLKAHEYALLVNAQALLQAAQGEVMKMRASAEEAAELRRRAGHEEGLREGLAEASTELAAGALRSTRLLRGLDEVIARAVSAALSDTVQEIPAEALYELALRKAAKAVRGENFLVLRVPPLREAAARQALAAVLEAGGFEGAVEVSVDSKLPDHACVLESESGVVSAGLDVQLSALNAAVAREVAQLCHTPRTA